MAGRRKAVGRAAGGAPSAEVELALLRQLTESVRASQEALRSEVARERLSLERQVARLEGMLEQLNSELTRMRGGGFGAGVLPEAGEGEGDSSEFEALSERMALRYGQTPSAEELLRLGGRRHGGPGPDAQGE